MRRLALLIPGVLLLVPAVWAGGGIHGVIDTTHDETLTGYIRWDKNENFWDDVLDARKDREVTVERRRKDVKLFGLHISSSGGSHKMRSQFSVPMGHLRMIEPTGSGTARLLLKNGEEIKVHAGSTDLGNSVRGITLVEAGGRETELEWKNIDRVVFSQGPDPGRDGERLYGTVETRRARFTGYIVWDRDESMTEDVLDGTGEGRKYKIPFGQIVAIERAGSSASLVYLDNGRELVLSGTNDVNHENRGIDVTIPGVGIVTVEWDEFRRVVFDDPPPSRRYEEFDGGSRLRGTVEDDEGRTYTGTIIWDRDEEYTWEPLNGSTLDVEFAIWFENIETIERESRKTARVTLRDGQVYSLGGSNDVTRDNKGVLIQLPDGEEIEIDWADLVEVRFEQ